MAAANDHASAGPVAEAEKAIFADTMGLLETSKRIFQETSKILDQRAKKIVASVRFVFGHDCGENEDTPHTFRQRLEFRIF